MASLTRVVKALALLPQGSTSGTAPANGGANFDDDTWSDKQASDDIASARRTARAKFEQVRFGFEWVAGLVVSVLSRANVCCQATNERRTEHKMSSSKPEVCAFLRGIVGVANFVISR